MALSQEELKAKLATLKWVFSESAYEGGNEKKLSLREIANIHLSNIDHLAETPPPKHVSTSAGPSKTKKSKNKRLKAKAKVIKSTKLSPKTKSKSKKIVKKKLRTSHGIQKVNNISPIVLSYKLSNTKTKPLKMVLKPKFKNKTVVTAGDGVRLLGGVAATRLAAQKLTTRQPVLTACKSKMITKNELKASSTKSKATKMLIKKKKSLKKPYTYVTARVDSGLNPGLQQMKSKSVTKKLKTKRPKRKTRSKYSSRVLFKNVLRPGLMTANDAAASAYELLHHNM